MKLENLNVRGKYFKLKMLGKIEHFKQFLNIFELNNLFRLSPVIGTFIHPSIPKIIESIC